MPSDRKFYKTTVTVTILSEEPISRGVELNDIAHQITLGDWSGEVDVGSPREVTARQVAALLKEQGSDPGFFTLDSDGNDAYRSLPPAPVAPDRSFTFCRAEDSMAGVIPLSSPRRG